MLDLTPPALRDRLTMRMSLKPWSFDGDTGVRTLRVNEYFRLSPADMGHLVLARQVHGRAVKEVKGVRTQEGEEPIHPDTDGLVTGTPGVVLGITTADCTAVMIYDPFHHAVGLAHAGWRGTAEGILEEMLSVMVERFHTSPPGVRSGAGTRYRSLLLRSGPRGDPGARRALRTVRWIDHPP